MLQLRAVLIALFLAACAASAPQVGGHPTRAPQANSVDDVYVSPRVVETALVCTADALRFCPPGGCVAANPGFVRPAPIAITTPSPGADVGRFCNGGDCQPGYFSHIRSRDGRWVADVWTGQNWTRPEGNLEVSRDRSNFRLRKPASDGVLEWTGFCQAAGS